MKLKITLLLLLWTVLHSAQAGRLEDDPFVGTKLDTCRWFDWSRSEGVVSQNDALKMSTSGANTFSNPRIISQYSVGGDASIEVSVTVDSGFEAPIDNAAQMYAAFGLWADESNFVIIALAKSTNSSVVRILRGNSSASGQEYQSFPDVPISSNAASFRISQSSGLISLEYRIDGTWIPLQTVNGFGSSTYAILQATTVGVKRQFSATFSNYRISSGATSFRPYVRSPLVRRADFMSGAIVGDYINYRTWAGKWTATDPIQVMADNGMNWIGTDLTTVSSPVLAALTPDQWHTVPYGSIEAGHWRSKELTGQVMKEIASRGMKIYLQLYLTNDSSFAGKQNAPSDWRNLSVDETALRLKSYTQEIVAAYKAMGISVGAYSIGNEIENGILNFYSASIEGGRIPVQPGVPSNDLRYLRTDVWPVEAKLLKAAIEGVKASDPNAKIVLHAAGLDYYPSDVITKAFFKSMVDEGVNYDFAALSHPYAVYQWNLHRYTTDCWMQRMQETTDYIADLGKKTIFSEGNYPAIDGAYSGPPMPEFPYSPMGQASWVREMLRFGNNNPNIAGFLYWDADYYLGVSTDHSIDLNPSNTGLFDSNEQPQPAMGEFKYSTVNLAFPKGWSLTGNGVKAAVPVASTFGDSANVSSVWSWIAAKSKWAFFTPLEVDGGATYAAANGYDSLTTINPGDGYWVNAKTAFTAQLPAGATVASSSFQNLTSGWRLIATGDTIAPSAFNTALSTTPPAVGVVPQNFNTLWTWDSTQSKWYFYAPSLEAQGGTALTDYITAHGYLDFRSANKTLGPGVGFWVNKQ